MTPRLIDWFSGAGGCAVGYARAGFAVIGVDLEPQKHYPFEFVQGDATDPDLVLELVRKYRPAAMHGSPPCQDPTARRRQAAGRCRMTGQRTRLTRRFSVSTIQSEVVTPSASAAARTRDHRSSGTRTARTGVGFPRGMSDRPRTELTRAGCAGQWRVRHPDDVVDGRAGHLATPRDGLAVTAHTGRQTVTDGAGAGDDGGGFHGPSRGRLCNTDTRRTVIRLSRVGRIVFPRVSQQLERAGRGRMWGASKKGAAPVCAANAHQGDFRTPNQEANGSMSIAAPDPVTFQQARREPARRRLGRWESLVRYYLRWEQ